jgi:hypothetical protein
MGRIKTIIRRGSVLSFVIVFVGLVLIVLLRDAPQFAAIAAIIGVAIGGALNFGLESEKWRWQRNSEIIAKRAGVVEDFVTHVAKFLRTVSEARQAINADPLSPIAQDRNHKFNIEFMDIYEQFDLIRTYALSFESAELLQVIKDLQNVLGQIRAIFLKVGSYPKSQEIFDLTATDSKGSLSALMDEMDEIIARALKILRQLQLEVP